MSRSVVHVEVNKPPAAIAGSPGTTIVSTESLGYSTALQAADLSSGSPYPRRTERDYIPPSWSFETSYSILGGMIGAPRMHNEQHKKDPKENAQVLQGSWFGRKREKVKQKDQSRSERSKSVDPPSRTAYPTKPPLPSPSLSSPGGISIPEQPSDIKSTSISDVSQTPFSKPGRVNVGPIHPNPTTPLSGSPIQSKSHLKMGLVSATASPYQGILRTAQPPSPATRTNRPRHPPSSFHSGNGPLGTSEKKRRPMTSSGVLTTQGPSGLRESFLGDDFNPHGTAEGHTSMSGSFTPYTHSHGIPPATEKPIPRDETPIESLKRRMKEARARGFTLKNAKRYHSIPRDEAPYTRNYEYKTLDFDEWTQLFELHLAKKCTFFPFTTAPRRVLDLGCGTGSWIVQCAKEWKDTTFVGLDLVPIQSDLNLIGEASLASRVEWVVGNFLQPLPFKDGEFDFVHAKRIARGVPENRWESLLDEITRVLKDGGAFEMVEENLFFPGSVLSESKGESSDEGSVDLSEVDVEPARTEEASSSLVDASARVTSLWLSEGEEDDMRPRRAQQTTTSISTDTQSSLSDRQKSHSSADVLPNGRTASGKSRKAGSSDAGGVLFHPLINPIINPRDHSVLETAYNELHASRFINLLPLSLLSSMLVYHFKGLVVISGYALKTKCTDADHQVDVCTHEQTEILFPKNDSRRKADHPNKRPVSLHASLSPPSSLIDPSKPSVSRRKSYHSNMYPRTANHQSSQPPEVFFRPLNMITDGVLRLPNDKWRFDERLLSMHLAIRVNEVLACAEEMWEFVQDCQSDPQRCKNTPMAGLSGLTKEEWDDCLVRFRLDMQDKAALGDLLRLQFPLGILPSPRKSERKLFEEAVERWETHRRQNNKTGNKMKRPKPCRPIACSFRIFIARKE